MYNVNFKISSIFSSPAFVYDNVLAGEALYQNKRPYHQFNIKSIKTFASLISNFVCICLDKLHLQSPPNDLILNMSLFAFNLKDAIRVFF